MIVRQSFAPLLRGRQLKAFSSEVASGSRQENASNQKDTTSVLISSEPRSSLFGAMKANRSTLPAVAERLPPEPESPLGVEHKT
jgi:hypothetical protein